MEDIKFANIYEGEYMISELIKSYGYYSHFDYRHVYNGGTNMILKIINYNPKNKTHFLLRQVRGYNKMNALHKMYNQLICENHLY
jgi:hypothetical protein